MQTEGITQDSIGFSIGPGEGMVRIPLRQESSSGVVKVLSAGSGRAQIGVVDVGQNPTIAPMSLPSDYSWVTATTSAASIGDIRELVVSVEDRSSLELADIQATGYDDTGMCAASPSHSRAPAWSAMWMVALLMAGALWRRRTNAHG